MRKGYEKFSRTCANSQPVIVVLGDPAGFAIGTHAVAILDIIPNAQDTDGETVVFYDPARGELREMRGIDFWSAWSLGGEYAFIIQP